MLKIFKTSSTIITNRMSDDSIRRTVANAWINRFSDDGKEREKTDADVKQVSKQSTPQDVKNRSIEQEQDPDTTNNAHFKRPKKASKELEVIEITDSDSDTGVQSISNLPKDDIEITIVDDDADIPIPMANVSDTHGKGPRGVKRVLSAPKPTSTASNSGTIPNSRSTHTSPLLPIHNPLYDNPKLRNSIVISDLLSTPDLATCYIFSFQHDLGFILPQFHSTDVDLKIIYQKNTVVDSPLRASFPNLQLIEVFMQEYTTHHPKLIINFYKDDTVKIFLLSCNMTQTEFETNNQMVWQSPILHKSDNTEMTPFKEHLFDFLKNYKKDPLNTLCLRLNYFDFTSIHCDFVSSATGSSKKFGYLGLYTSLLRKGLIPKKFNKQRYLLYQTSSMASAIGYSPKSMESSNLFTHLIAPLVSGKYNDRGKLNFQYSKFPMAHGYQSVADFSAEWKVKPYIIFPSLSDVRNSYFGYRSGGWSHYNPSTKWNIPMNKFLTQNVLHHSFSKQRGTNSSHTKFLIMSSDNFKTLDWVLFTSANLSKQAWGLPVKKENLSNPQSYVSNYETGVLLSPKDYGPNAKFIPLEFGEEKILQDDEVPIYLPFRLPPAKYTEDDEPWFMGKDSNLPDLLGNIHLAPLGR